MFPAKKIWRWPIYSVIDLIIFTSNEMSEFDAIFFVEETLWFLDIFLVS